MGEYNLLSAGKPCLLRNKRALSQCIRYKESVNQLKG